MSSSAILPRPCSADSPEGTTKILRFGDAEANADSAVGLGRDDLVALVVTELRRSYHEGRPVDLSQYRPWLDQVKATPDDWLLLIELEVELRDRFGPKPVIEDYVSRFPAFAEKIPGIFEQFASSPLPTNTTKHPCDSVLSLFTPTSPTTPRHGMTLAHDRMVPRQDITIPGYDIIGMLGRGGMGVVYKARQVGLNRVVALKMLLAGNHADDEDLARFRQEAEAVAALQHPNIVQVYEIGEYQGTPYFSMEYIDGGTLATKIAEQPQSPEFAAKMAEMLARAIHAAHRQNIVHRDLKPANVLLASCTRGEVNGKRNEQTDSHSDTVIYQPVPTPKITDFGLAKRLDSALKLTVSGLVAGTPQYMAPEQVAMGRRSVGPAVDIYAIGVMLYEMLTGRPPFLGKGPAELMQQVVHQEPVPVRQLRPNTPRDLETICLKCLRKEPERRYATAEDLAEDLQRFRDGKMILARPVGKVEQAVRWCRRNPAVASLLLITTLTLATGAGVASVLAVNAAEQARRAEASEREARRQEQAALKVADELRHEKKAVEEAHQQVAKALAELKDARLDEERLIKERDMLRAAANACRLTGFHVDGKMQTGERIAVSFDLTNVSGKSWPLPMPGSGPAPKRILARLIAEPILDGVVHPEDGIPCGRLEFNPDHAIDAGYRWTGRFVGSLKSVKPGKYQLKLEHAWIGNDLQTISEKAIEATIDPASSSPANSMRTSIPGPTALSVSRDDN